MILAPLNVDPGPEGLNLHGAGAVLLLLGVLYGLLYVSSKWPRR